MNKPGATVLETEGVRSHDYRLMAEDFLQQQELRPAKEKACFHGILSFYPGENPSDAQITEIAESYFQKLGITETQYAITKHTDRQHLHVHLIANMVNNKGESISDSWIGWRGKKAAQQLTQQYGLIPAQGKSQALTNENALSNSEGNKYKIYKAQP